MISADSLQVLNNEMVQSAIDSAHGNGLTIGMIIGVLAMVLILSIILMVNKKERQSIEKEHALWKYRRLKMEMSWVSMIDICKECIDGDVSIAKPTLVIFNEFPGYDEERRNKELQLFPKVAQKYQELIEYRSTVVDTLQTMIDRDIKYINDDMKLIESKYPMETTQYNKEHDEYVKKNNKQQLII